MVRQPHVHMLVGVADAVIGQNVGLKHPTRRHREPCEDREAGDGDHEERDDGAARKPRAGTPGEAAGAGVEHAAAGAAGDAWRAPFRCVLRSARLGLRAGLHSRGFPVLPAGQTGVMAGNRC